MFMITQRSHDDGDISVGRGFYSAGSVGTVEERRRLGDVLRVLVVTYPHNFNYAEDNEERKMFTWVEDSRRF